MKRSVTLKLEAIGLYSKVRIEGCSHFNARTGKAPWVAEIPYFDDKYIFKRWFLQGMCDYTESNSVGSRGIYYYFHCFPGPIYETWHKKTWKKEERYFFRVVGNEIKRLEKIEVIRCLSCI